VEIGRVKQGQEKGKARQFRRRFGDFVVDGGMALGWRRDAMGGSAAMWQWSSIDSWPVAGYWT